MGLSGDVARLVGGEEHRERRHFLRRAEPSHRLAVDEVLPHRIDRPVARFREVGDTGVERRRLDRAGADRVRPDALLDEVGRHRLGDPDDRGTPRIEDTAEAMLMIEPRRFSTIPGRNARSMRWTEVTLRSNETAQSASLQSSTLP
jgi:hypothetical protein